MLQTQKYNRMAAFAILVTLVVMGTGFLLPAPVSKTLLKEGGFIESVSAAMYFMAVAVLLRLAVVTWPFATIVLSFGLRELDMDKIPFTEGLLKSKQYLSSSVPTTERIVSALVLVGILSTFALCIKRGSRSFFRNIKKNDTLAWTFVLAAFLGLTAKSLDGIDRKFAPFSINVSENTVRFASIYEESAELGMALSIFLISLVYVKNTVTQKEMPYGNSRR